MKIINIVIPCFNEEKNVEKIYFEIKKLFESLPQYRYEFIFIDNCSQDQTVSVLKNIAKNDKNVKIIVNSRNFGYIRSSFHGLIQARGDATIFIHSDLQENHMLISQFIKKWEEGYKIVLGVKTKSKENFILFWLRSLFYNIISKISVVEQVGHYTGFGLYDKSIINILRSLKEPYPYLRGIITEIGFERAIITYEQDIRKEGKSKFNFYDLYDIAMLGIINYSKIPLRFAIFVGFLMSIISILIAIVYFIEKLLLWDSFTGGLAPVIIGLFFFMSIQLIFIGIVGEYIGAIHTNVLNRPLVFEKERINFDTEENKNIHK